MDAKDAVTGAAKKAADGAQRMAGYEPQSRWQDNDDDDIDDEEWYALLQLLSHVSCTHTSTCDDSNDQLVQ